MKPLLCALLLSAATAFAQQEPAIPYGDNPAVGKYYDVNGIKLYCEIYGSGKPLLLLHGSGGSIAAFADNIPYLAKKYQVIAVDSRAQGKSKDPGDALTFEMMADDFAGLLEALHIESAYVIGWSDGGINALLLAMRHPEKVTALVATGANISPDASAFAPDAWQSMKEEHDTLLREPPKTDAEKDAAKLFLLDWKEPNIPPAALQAIRCPSLIVCGDHDMISIEHTALIYKSIPRAYLWVVPNSGHATLMEHHEEFNQKADDFFSTPFNERKP